MIAKKKKEERTECGRQPTNFETRKDDLIEFGIPANGVSRVYFPEINADETACAGLEITEVSIVAFGGRVL